MADTSWLHASEIGAPQREAQPNLRPTHVVRRCVDWSSMTGMCVMINQRHNRIHTCSCPLAHALWIILGFFPSFLSIYYPIFGDSLLSSRHYIVSIVLWRQVILSGPDWFLLLRLDHPMTLGAWACPGLLVEHCPFAMTKRRTGFVHLIV